jgi:hypothetical protein
MAVLGGIVQTNEEAKQYCNRPADVPMVLGSVGTHEHSSTQEEGDDSDDDSDVESYTL